MRSFQYDAGSDKPYVESEQPEQATEQATPVPGVGSSSISDSLTAFHTIIQGGGKGVSSFHYFNAVNTVNRTLGNRNFLQFMSEHLQPGRQQVAHVLPAAPLQMMPAKRKKMSEKGLRQKQPDQAARLAEGEQSPKSEEGRIPGSGRREDLLHALGTAASVNPPGLGRPVEEMAAASPGKGATLRHLAAAASVSDITDIDTAFSNVQTAIDRLMGELDLSIINAITDPSRAAVTPKKAAPESAKKLEMKSAGISRLRALAADPDLTQILEAAELLGYEVGKADGQICLVIGGITYAIEGQIGLLHQLFFDDDKHVIFDWYVGYHKHFRPEALSRTLAAHRPLLGNRMSVHAAAYQADWNPDIIQRYFGELSDSAKVAKCAANRVADATSYITQARREGVGFDVMIKETMPGKEAHVRKVAEDIAGIIEDFKASREMTELLLQRVPLMEDFARHYKRWTRRKRTLDRQLKAFHMQSRRMYGEGTDKARRAELVCHSMSVLEEIAARCIRRDPDTIQRLFSSGAGTGAGADAGHAFYQRLYGAMGDYKTAKQMGAREYEFERFSAAHDLIYVYPVEAGPFLTGACRSRVGVLVGRPLNVTGVPISVVLPELGELRVPPACSKLPEDGRRLFRIFEKEEMIRTDPYPEP